MVLQFALSCEQKIWVEVGKRVYLVSNTVRVKVAAAEGKILGRIWFVEVDACER